MEKRKECLKLNREEGKGGGEVTHGCLTINKYPQNTNAWVYTLIKVVDSKEQN